MLPLASASGGNSAGPARLFASFHRPGAQKGAAPDGIAIAGGGDQPPDQLEAGGHGFGDLDGPDPRLERGEAGLETHLRVVRPQHATESGWKDLWNAPHRGDITLVHTYDRGHRDGEYARSDHPRGGRLAPRERLLPDPR